MAISPISEVYGNTINGQKRTTGKPYQSIDPNTLQPLWNIPIATQSDLDEAVRSAQHAFPSWSQRTWTERREKLAQMSKILAEHQDEMMGILMKEGGKPELLATIEILDSIKMLDFHANHPPLSETTIQDDADLKLTLTYHPLGVVGAIGPWNFPLVICIGKIAAGLLTGNTVIVKPSPFTPYSILKFIEWVQPLLPPGVLQGLNGDNSLGPAMVTHPGIPKITFTGSTATGKKIMEAGAKGLKRITLELGGNDACIVCPDIVDIKHVAEQVAMGAFFNSGQICVASKRIYVHEDIYQEFLKAMVDVVASWSVGPGSVPGLLGPVQNEMQYKIVKKYFDDCKAKSYKFALGGGEINSGESFRIQPAIIDNPPEDSLIVTTEPFGPIVPVQSWKTEDEVIERASSTLSGLGGSIWTPDIEKAYRMARQMKTGTVWVNGIGKPLAQAYFAGNKESGIGGESGTQGLLSYCYSTMIHHYKSKL